ncbi:MULTISPECIES: hypothetical protein [unclassified Streptomyces]|nr:MULTISPECIES: hypothetical protein [unclassified Streptomyces]MCX5440087.1 hypothetical protein [Streptomyces sp. NBC_00063]WSE17607.1 hypothetical protein OG518_32080 [Streptomyces sp. NBC_01397]WUB93501.1 hypothetical protein OHO83_14960 [Streptomyces sp. NBC_00569]
METILLNHETQVTLPSYLELHGVPCRIPLLLAGDLDDDGSEPHICRSID